MQGIPDKSVDLVLTDPPYNISKAEWDKWKRKEDYIEWMGQIFKECERLLKDNGSFYFFHNDMMQMVDLMKWIKDNTKFVFNSFITWDKGNFRSLAWKNPSDKSNLRSWFNSCEYIMYYTFEDGTGLTTVMFDTNNFPSMRGYFKGLQEYIDRNKKQILEMIGQKADHCFRWNSSQWDMPTPETYQQLINIYQIDKWPNFREYEDLRREYEDLRREYEDLRYTHNLDRNHKNVWRYPSKNTGLYHPTEKPMSIIVRIIGASSNKGDIILDPFLGSGTTAIAAHNTGRFFIGIEKEPKYVEIARKRLEQAQAQQSLFA
jgi:DNA modification methylase